VTVRVVGRDGRPRVRARVAIGKDSFFGGVSGSVYTNQDGEAEFRCDHGGPLIIYVDGSTALKNQPMRSYYKVTVG